MDRKHPSVRDSRVSLTMITQHQVPRRGLCIHRAPVAEFHYLRSIDQKKERAQEGIQMGPRLP